MSGREFYIQTCSPRTLIWIVNFPNGKRIWMKLQLIWIKKKQLCTCTEWRECENRKVNLKLDDIFNFHAIVSQEIIQTAERAEDKPWCVYACKIISRKWINAYEKLLVSCDLADVLFPFTLSSFFSRFTSFIFYLFIFFYFHFSK